MPMQSESSRTILALIDVEDDSTFDVLSAALSTVISPAFAIAVATSLPAYRAGYASEDEWLETLTEVLTDVGVSSSCAEAQALLAVLMDRGVLTSCAEQSPSVTTPTASVHGATSLDLTHGDDDPWVPGRLVLAELSEDGEWHLATLEEELPATITEAPTGRAGARRRRRADARSCSNGESSRTFRVIFLEFDKPQAVGCGTGFGVALFDQAVDDDECDQPLGVGPCQLCERELPLTFHHLVPKDDHSRWLGKRLPPGVAEAVAREAPPDAPAPAPTRALLNSWGAELCRPCHSAVHRAASNTRLAADLNTLEKLRGEPAVASWIVYARTQRHPGRG